jgi:hypothetical protein
MGSHDLHDVLLRLLFGLMDWRRCGPGQERSG